MILLLTLNPEAYLESCQTYMIFFLQKWLKAVNPFMHNVVKWPFYNIMHERAIFTKKKLDHRC